MRLGAIVTLLLAVTPLCGQSKTQVAELAVVRTFADLMNQPVLALKDGVKVRAGIEASSVPQHGVVLVYALVESKHVMASGELGPLHVELARSGDHKKEVVLRAMDMARRGSDLRSPFFFMTAVHLDEPGNFHLTLRGPEGEAAAHARLTATENNSHVWLPFREHDPAPGQGRAEKAAERPEDADRPQHVSLRIAPRHTAGPRLDGTRPLPTPRDGINHALVLKAPLPRWHMAIDPRLQLKATARGLELTGPPLDLDDPDRKLLVRVWVNQKPFEPGKIRESDSGDHMARARLDFERKDTRLHIEMPMDFKALGASSGDRVALQLLYCPDGIHLFNRGEGKRGESKKVREEEESVRLPRMTAKVEWRVP